MSARSNKDTIEMAATSRLSRYDIGLMLVMCTDLVNLCAKLTAKIDPAAAATLTYVRDDIAAENKNEMDRVRATNLILGNGHASVREPSRLK